eukprot:g6447.t1
MDVLLQLRNEEGVGLLRELKASLYAVLDRLKESDPMWREPHGLEPWMLRGCSLDSCPEELPDVGQKYAEQQGDDERLALFRKRRGAAETNAFLFYAAQHVLRSQFFRVPEPSAADMLEAGRAVIQASLPAGQDVEQMFAADLRQATKTAQPRIQAVLNRQWQFLDPLWQLQGYHFYADKEEERIRQLVAAEEQERRDESPASSSKEKMLNDQGGPHRYRLLSSGVFKCVTNADFSLRDLQQRGVLDVLVAGGEGGNDTGRAPEGDEGVLALYDSAQFLTYEVEPNRVNLNPIFPDQMGAECDNDLGATPAGLKICDYVCYPFGMQTLLFSILFGAVGKSAARCCPLIKRQKTLNKILAYSCSALLATAEIFGVIMGVYFAFRACLPPVTKETHPHLLWAEAEFNEATGHYEVDFEYLNRKSTFVFWPTLTGMVKNPVADALRPAHLVEEPAEDPDTTLLEALLDADFGGDARMQERDDGEQYFDDDDDDGEDDGSSMLQKVLSKISAPGGSFRGGGAGVARAAAAGGEVGYPAAKEDETRAARGRTALATLNVPPLDVVTAIILVSGVADHNGAVQEGLDMFWHLFRLKQSLEYLYPNHRHLIYVRRFENHFDILDFFDFKRTGVKVIKNLIWFELRMHGHPDVMKTSKDVVEREREEEVYLVGSEDDVDEKPANIKGSSDTAVKTMSANKQSLAERKVRQTTWCCCIRGRQRRYHPYYEAVAGQQISIPALQKRHSYRVDPSDENFDEFWFVKVVLQLSRATNPVYPLTMYNMSCEIGRDPENGIAHSIISLFQQLNKKKKVPMQLFAARESLAPRMPNDLPVPILVFETGGGGSGTTSTSPSGGGGGGSAGGAGAEGRSSWQENPYKFVVNHAYVRNPKTMKDKPYGRVSHHESMDGKVKDFDYLLTRYLVNDKNQMDYQYCRHL